MRFVYCSCLRTRRIVLTAYVVVPVGATIVTRTRRLHHGRTVTVARVAHARVTHARVTHARVANARVTHARVARARVAHARVAHARVAAAVGGAHILTNHHAGTIGKTTEGAERSGLVDAVGTVANELGADTDAGVGSSSSTNIDKATNAARVGAPVRSSVDGRTGGHGRRGKGAVLEVAVARVAHARGRVAGVTKAGVRVLLPVPLGSPQTAASAARARKFGLCRRFTRRTSGWISRGWRCDGWKCGWLWGRVGSGVVGGPVRIDGRISTCLCIPGLEGEGLLQYKEHE